MFGLPRPAWSGMIQLVHCGSHPGKSSVMILPMIDISPNDTTRIYSTLKYVQKHVQHHDVTPIITFDQPLWWKALMIILTEPIGSSLRDIVLRLGGFQTGMSFLGCIGHLMAASGLQELLKLIYAPNAVVHMLSGKAISRAVQGHLIVDAALNTLVLAQMFNMPVPGVPNAENEETDVVVGLPELHEHSTDLEEAGIFYGRLMQGLVSVDQVCRSEAITRIVNALQKASMKSSRTAILWMQCMDMVDIFRKFIRAERTGNCDLYLQVVSEMLPFLAASGQNNYTKSALI